MLKSKKITLSKIYPYFFTALFLVLSILLIINHEYWRDEVRAWLIGSESANLREFVGNIRDNEGHPYLWSGLLYFISHYITDNLEAMKILHLAISVVVVFLILKYAPFNKILRVMLVFSYYLFFEYSIISRNYSIGILFMIIFCILYKNKYKNLIPISIVLFLMGLGNIYSFVISIILFLFLLFEFLLERRNIKNRINKLHMSIASAIIIGSILFMYWQLGSQMKSGTVWAPSIFSIFNKNIINEYIKSIGTIPEALIKSYLPIPNFVLNFWNTNIIFDFLSKINYLFVYLLALVLFVFSLFFIKKKVLFLYIIGNLSIAIIPIFVHTGSLRHYGHFFILLIVCIWISYLKPKENYLIKDRNQFKENLMNGFLIICLTSSLIGSGVAFCFDFKYPFSSGKDTANYIEKNFNVDELVIIGYLDYPTETIAGYLNKDIYYPQSIDENKFRKLNSWSRRIGGYDIYLPISSANKFILDSKKVLLVISSPPDDAKEELSKNHFKQIEQTFDSSIVGEDFYLYLFDK